MMLKKKSKVKLGGAVFLALLFCISYVGTSFYSVPEQASVATWFPQEETRTLADIEYMQDMNKTICDNSNIGDTNTSVKDNRDNNVYSIGKLADGKCWMTQNLRIVGNRTLTSSTTDVVEDFYLPASSLDYFSDNEKAYLYYNNVKSYGAYYSWCAATAGTCKKDGLPIDAGDATSSICPKGWRLPTRSEYMAINGEHVIVDSGNWTGQNLNAGFMISDAFWPAAGQVVTNPTNGSGYLSNVGTDGFYWTGTASSATEAYQTYFRQNYNPSAYYGKERHEGNSVRCIARDDTLSESVQAETSSGNISVSVGKYITIDATTDMLGEVDGVSVLEGNISAKISSNTEYKVSLSADETSLKNNEDPDYIGIPASSEVRSGNSAWGIATNTDRSAYIGITNQPSSEYYATITNTEDRMKLHTYLVGISVAPSVPAGTYTTEVTITAAAL